MTDTLDSQDVMAGLHRLCETLINARESLNSLDAAIGDADCGTTVAGAFESLREALPTLEGSPGELLRKAGMILMRSQGGASGPLFSTALREAAKAAGSAEALHAVLVGDMLAAATAGVMRLGKSAPGDKTLLDALAPAAQLFAAQAAQGENLAACATAAARAARQGSEATKELIAKRGRAHYLGKRGLGHADPGAVAVALAFEAFA